MTLPDGLVLQPVVTPVLLGIVLGAAVLVCLWSLVRSRGVAERARWLPRLLAVLAAGVVCLRPTLPGELAEAAMSDTDVYVVVDTTVSMAATDGPDGTSRLDLARADVVALLDQLGAAGARASLVTFDREARTVVPLTRDVSAVARAVALLQPEVAAGSSGSSVTVAGPLLNRTLSRVAQTYPDRSTVVLYLGDGEHTAQTPPASLAPLADLVQGGLVLGYGTPAGATMPARGADGSLVLVPATGEPAVSRADADQLRALADDLGVEHVQRTDGPPPPVAAPTVRPTETELSGVPGGSEEYTWWAALALAGLLALDLAGTLVGLVRSGVPRRVP